MSDKTIFLYVCYTNENKFACSECIICKLNIGYYYRRKSGWEQDTLLGCQAPLPVSFLFSRFSLWCAVRLVTALSVDPGNPSVLADFSTSVCLL